MALFENFPYTDLHQLNLDWLINEIKKIEDSQVISVNGQTGEVILYQDAQMMLPSVTADHWSIGRITDGTYRGIMFGNDNKAYIVHGNMMSQIYGVNNPPPYPVSSVNGETGDVILYSSASVQLPSLNDAQLRNWNLWRDLNGIMRGIQFDDTGKAYLIAGSNRYDFYTSNNPPQYPVTSVNGQTGTVLLNIPDAFVDNPAAGELTIAEDIPDASVWALLRETENGYVGIAVNNGVNPAAYLQIGTGANAQRIQLLTSADIPQSAGVVSINGLTGVVTINGSQISVSGSDGRSITTALAALDGKTGADIAVSGTDSRKINVALSDIETEINNVRAAFVYDENGNTTAAHNIPSGSYVFWNNGAYKAASAIAIGDTFSTTNLSAVPAGGITNDLNGNLNLIASKLPWTYVGEETGQNHINLPASFNEVMAVAIWANNSTITVSATYPKNILSSARCRWLGGTYSSPTDFHGVQIDFYDTYVNLEAWNNNGGNNVANSRLKVYVR